MTILNLNLRHSESNIFFSSRPVWASALGRALTLEEIKELVNGKRVLVLLHGYRNTVDAADDAYSSLLLRFQSLGQSPYDVAVCVHMPLSRYMLGFAFARVRASKAGEMLRKALSYLPVASIDVQTHSLGGLVALEALRHGLWCRNLIMSAPAVHNNALEERHYGKYLDQADRVLVCYSNDDPVDWPFRFASWDKMLGCSGPQYPATLPVNVTVRNFTDVVVKHSGYKSCELYLRLWRSYAMRTGDSALRHSVTTQ